MIQNLSLASTNRRLEASCRPVGILDRQHTPSDRERAMPGSSHHRAMFCSRRKLLRGRALGALVGHRMVACRLLSEAASFATFLVAPSGPLDGMSLTPCR